MRRLIGPALTALLVVALATIGAAQTQAGPTVIPGQSVGQFQLGEDVDTIVTALGPLHSQDDLPGNALVGYYWPLRRLGAIADKTTSKVVALVVSQDDSYKTDKGVTAGDGMEAVRNAYGPEDSVDDHQDAETLVYDKLGVAFMVDKSGPLGSRVSVIFVFDPGRYRDIFGNPTQ
jgi:hypothetical protein